MEILLAIVVASAVIFFGALISMGNERQRKAIDSLREQVVLWALQDLKIKQEHLAQSVQVLDPMDWLNKIASKVCGSDLNLQILEIIEKPQSLVCSSSDGSIKTIFSIHSPDDVRRIKSNKQNRLSRFAANNLLLLFYREMESHEISALNAGPSFDLELAIVWKALAGTDIGQSNRIWVYFLKSNA